MLKNTLSIIARIIICYFPIVFVPCACYAVKITVENIEIPCSEDFRDAPKYKYEGEPKTQYILEAIGIKEAGIDGIIGFKEYWNKILDKPGFGNYLNYDVHVAAECIMAGYTKYYNMWPPGKIITCKKGEGLSIAMLAPNDPNPNKYHYVAKLTKIRDDDDDGLTSQGDEALKIMKKDLPVKGVNLLKNIRFNSVSDFCSIL
jgi:hypothetical protein